MIRIIEILAALQASSAAEPLKSLTDHTDEGVKATAQWALKQLGV